MSFLLRFTGAGVALGLASLAVAPGLLPRLDGASADAKPAGSRAAPFAPLPPVNDKAGAGLLELSPFAADRSAFDRATATVPTAAPVEVRLTGIFRFGKELRASLNVGGQSLVVRNGDETPAGKVGKISASSVTLLGPPERSIDIFK